MIVLRSVSISDRTDGWALPRAFVFALAALLALAGCDHEDGPVAPVDPPPEEPSDAAESAGGSVGTEVSPDPVGAGEAAEDPAADAADDPAGEGDGTATDPTATGVDPASPADGGAGGSDGAGGGGDCSGAWMTDSNALEATLEAVMAAQGVEVEYEVLRNGFMEIREDGAVIVEYDELMMFGDLGSGSIELTFSWAATGSIVDGELTLEGFEDPVLDASMSIAGQPFDMTDMIADMELTTGFASPAPVAVACSGDAVTLTPADPIWALRFVPLG